MKNGYKILWTDHALKELSDTYAYLESNFSHKVLKNLSIELDNILALITNNPKLFPKSHLVNVRKVVVKRFNTLYYRINGDTIEILSFFSNRQNPEKLKI